MLRRFLIPVLIFIPLAIIQLTLVPLITYEFISPDVIVILLVFFSVRYGQIYGTFLGFILGFLFDIISGGLLGSAMFSKTLSGFIAGYFSKENPVDSPINNFSIVFIIFLCSSIDTFFYAILGASQIELSFIFLIFQQGILPGFYTAVISMPILIFKPGEKLL